MTMLSVVIPAYKEEDGIQAIAERVLGVRDALAQEGVELELIVVDDGSRDQTAAVAATIPGVRLVRHVRNGGYGAALKTGFAAARGEWLGFLDADGTYPPEHFPDLYRKAQESGADIVIGSRMAGADSEMPLVRRIGNLIFARLVNVISASHITDSASGMRIFRKSILERLYPLPDGLNLTPVMSTRALHERLLMVEVPIPYSERVGRSKLSVVRDGMRFGQSIVWTALNYNPARPLGIVGLVLLGLAALVGLGLVLARAAGVTVVDAVGAFPIYMGMVLAVAGVSVLALGSSFNYFVALFHKTPVRQGLLGRPLFRRRSDVRYGLAGLAVLGLGLLVALASLLLALRGWTVTQLWLYYLASAALCLIGVQLVISWIQIQVLEALAGREALAASDLRGKEHRTVAPAAPVESAPDLRDAPALQPQP